jgi:DHA2 family methylenomycin A resistance protein-like MFS transporter
VGWRSIFLVNLPIGLVGLWLTWRYATETARAVDRELDVLGQVSVIGALGCLAGSVIEGGPMGWSNPWVLSGFSAFFVLAALFVIQERRVHQPMLPLALFRRGLFALTSAVGLLVNMAFYGLIFVLSLYFQQVNGFTPFETGLAFLPMMGAVLPMNLLAARASGRYGASAVIALGATASAAGCIALIGIARGTSYWAICAPVIAIGAGLGLLVPPLTSTLLGSVEKARSGIAAGVLNATRQTGSVVGVALFGSLVVKANAFIPGMRESLIISATLLLAAAIAITVGRHRK